MSEIEIFWHNELTGKFAQKLQALIDNCVVLPNRNILVKIITAYLCLPRIARNETPPYLQLPYLYHYGKSGSGKSTIGQIAAAIHGLTAIAGSSTPASIRNYVNQYGWLIWDDIEEKFLLNPILYAYLKVGYSYKGLTTIANPQGENTEYFTFCPKIFSSVSFFLFKSEYSEIQRRLLVISHKRLSDLSAPELEQYNKIFPDEINLLSVNPVDLAFLRQKYLENCTELIIELAKGLSTHYRSRKRDFKLPKSISNQNWQLVADIAAYGLTFGVWLNLDEVLANFSLYFEWQENFYCNRQNSLAQLLANFVGEYHEFKGDKDAIKFIDPQVLKQHIAVATNAGWLSVNPNPNLVNMEMEKLGYRLQMINGKMQWIKD